jgi:hypothetical protein
MAVAKVKTTGVGGGKSRWCGRAEAKAGARKLRRAEDGAYARGRDSHPLYGPRA